MSGRPTTPTLTGGQIVLLREIADDNITWRSDMAGRKSFRQWSSETNYVTVTTKMLRLQKLGLFRCYHGHLFGRGGIELTADGRALLREPTA